MALFIDSNYIVNSLLVAIITAISAVFLTSDCDLYLKFCKYDKTNGFKNKIVWIVGASSGIGASMAHDFVKGGAQVILSARRKDLLEQVAADCSKYGLKPIVIELDILKTDSQEKAYQAIIKQYGHIDIVILNAGKGQRSLAVETPLSGTQDMIQLNYISYVSLTNIILPQMISRKNGHIVVISSMAGRIGTPLSAAYSGSKFALHGYFDGLRAEISQPYNIHISIVCPGPTESEFALHRVEVGNQGNAKETKKMATARCSYLIAKGVYNEVDEMWISRQPVLLSAYIHTYMPWLSRQLYKNMIGPSRVKIMSSGGDPYDLLKLLGLKK